MWKSCNPINIKAEVAIGKLSDFWGCKYGLVNVSEMDPLFYHSLRSAITAENSHRKCKCSNKASLNKSHCVWPYLYVRSENCYL